MDDETLAGALASNLEVGFEAVVCAYQQRLYAFALRLTGSTRDAEEIAQDAFVRAYRALVGYEWERIRALKLRAWLFQITINVARNRTRGRRVGEVPLSTPDDRDGAAIDLPDDDDADQPEVVAERHDDEARLAAIVASLPERYRAAVVLRHVEGLSYQEIATALRQPPGTVKSNVHRGVALLRDALGQTDAADGQPAPASERELLGGAR